MNLSGGVKRVQLMRFVVGISLEEFKRYYATACMFIFYNYPFFLHAHVLTICRIFASSSPKKNWGSEVTRRTQMELTAMLGYIEDFTRI